MMKFCGICGKNLKDNEECNCKTKESFCGVCGNLSSNCHCNNSKEIKENNSNELNIPIVNLKKTDVHKSTIPIENFNSSNVLSLNNDDLFSKKKFFIGAFLGALCTLSFYFLFLNKK